MATYDYDLFVIGGGSGGVRAGRLAGAMGKRVGLAEEYRMGGTCVIRGCVPKKLFVYASQILIEARQYLLAAIDKRGVDAKAMENIGEFHRDIAAALDDNGFRQRIQMKRFI